MKASFQLRATQVAFRYGAKPWLRRTRDIAKTQDALLNGTRLAPVAPHVSHRVAQLGECQAHWFQAGPTRMGQICLYFHGGAYMAGSGETHRGMLGRLALLSGVEIVAPDYHLLHEAPFPAAVDDAIAAWDDLLSRGYEPTDIVIGGDSAGGGLAFALLAHCCAQGTPPAGVFAFSPWLDQTGSGDTIRTNAKREAILPAERIEEAAKMYLAGADPSDPRASPLHAAFPEAPPVLLQVARGEILRSDSDRMEEKLREDGVDVELQHWPGALHVWQMFDGIIPEARLALEATAEFLHRCLPAENR